MFEWIPNASPIGGAVNVGYRQTAITWNLQPQTGVQRSS